MWLLEMSLEQDWSLLKYSKHVLLDTYLLTSFVPIASFVHRDESVSRSLNEEAILQGEP
jgi:hypothetical protein